MHDPGASVINTYKKVCGGFFFSGNARRKHAAVVFLSVFLFITAIIPGCKGKEGVQPLDVGSQAPDFTLKDTEGAVISMSSQRGKVVALEFWAMWCLPCRESIPEFNSIYKKYSGKNFSLFSISMDEGPDMLKELKSFKKENGMLYPVLFDASNVDDLYGIIRVPTTLIIDKNGIISGIHYGYMPGMEETLSKEIERLL
jgi:peroxiredoxin